MPNKSTKRGLEMNHKQALKIVNMRVRREFGSLTEASDGLNIDYSHLTAMLRGAKPLTGRLARWAGLKPIKTISYQYEVIQ
jgi:hypothetical protein